MPKAEFTVLENEWIPLTDGRRLAARIWMPKVGKVPAPAVLEYLPYRKRDGTAARDESTYPVFAEAGYVGVRVDISGTGESDGNFDDEYSPRELNDACEVITWITNQGWCNGNVGMMGISWGGFNSLQVAALKPPALKAVISIGSTVDRYNDDIHYKNGCLLSSNFNWSDVKPSLPRERDSGRWVERDLQTGETHYQVIDDTGEEEMPGHGLRTRHYHHDCWSIKSNDPLSCRATSRYNSWMRRDNWSIKTESSSSLSCDAENFYIEATVTAYEADLQVNHRHWKKTIKRDLM